MQEVLLNHAPRMTSPNLILVFKILKDSELGLWADSQLNRVRTLIVALMERINMEFDALHGKESDEEDDLAHVLHHYEQLSPWCIPCVEVLESHAFLLSSASQEHVQAQKREMDESIASMSLSEQAMLEQRRTERQRKSAVGSIQTVIGAKR